LAQPCWRRRWHCEAGKRAGITATGGDSPRRQADRQRSKRRSNCQTRREAAETRVLVTISKETTYITEPLRKDGYVDYLAALNERGKKDVTPENNAAVLFWQAMGPSEVKPEIRSRYFRMLGMERPPEKGDYFVPLDKFVQRLRNARDSRVAQLRTLGTGPFDRQLTDALRRPGQRKSTLCWLTGWTPTKSHWTCW